MSDQKKAPALGRGFLLMINPISILADGGKLICQIQDENNSIIFMCLDDFCEFWGLDMRFWLEIAEEKVLSDLSREAY